jgi:hypothetical protein
VNNISKSEFQEQMRQLAGIKGVSAPAHGGYPGTSPNSNSTYTSNGNVYSSQQHWSPGPKGTYIPVNGVDTSLVSSGMALRSHSPDLPPIVINTEDEHCNPVRMTLKPEHGIGPHETLRLVMLLIAAAQSPSLFNALAHVKKQGLERHFTYS